MGLAELSARLERDAEVRVAAIEAEAAAEEERILAQAAKAAAERRATTVRAARAGRAAILGKALAERTKAARASELEAEHALLDRVFDRAAALMPRLSSDPTFIDALGVRLEEALAFLEGDAVVVRAPPAIARALAPMVEGRPGARLIEDASVGTGFVAERPDGSVKVDDTLEARLAQRRARAAIQVIAEVRR